VRVEEMNREAAAVSQTARGRRKPAHIGSCAIASNYRYEKTQNVAIGERKVQDAFGFF
jgi:hypothetical protein